MCKLCIVFSAHSGQKKVIAGLVFIQRFDSLLYDPFFQRNAHTPNALVFLKMHTTKKKIAVVFSPYQQQPKFDGKLAQIGNPTGQQNPTFHRTITSFKGVKIDVGHSKLKKPTIEKFVLTSGEKNSKQKRLFFCL